MCPASRLFAHALYQFLIQTLTAVLLKRPRALLLSSEYQRRAGIFLSVRRLVSVFHGWLAVAPLAEFVPVSVDGLFAA